MAKINKVPIIIFLIILVGVAVFNKKLMPTSKELTELELTKVIGMDKVDEGKFKIEQTVVRVKNEEESNTPQGGGGGSSDSGGQEKKPKIFTTRAVTFSDAIRGFQTFVNKTMAGSHIKCMILGEDFCKEDMSLNMDFNTRDFEVRLNSSVYIAKNSSAKDFIKKVATNEYGIDEKVFSMEENNDSKSFSYKTTALDVISMLADDDSCGLIPSLEVITEEDGKTIESKNDTENIQDFQSPQVEATENSEVFFDFAGYGIIHKRKLIGYLCRHESITCNMLKNKLKGTNINIDLGEDGIVSFAIIRSKTGYDFKFDGEKLTEVIIKNDTRLNFEEIATGENVFTYEKIEELEQKVLDQIKKDIEQNIEKMKEYQCDFVNIEDTFKIKHPYKYEKIQENWIDELLSAKFTIDTKSKILRTYDILKLN